MLQWKDICSNKKRRSVLSERIHERYAIGRHYPTVQLSQILDSLRLGSGYNHQNNSAKCSDYIQVIDSACSSEHKTIANWAVSNQTSQTMGRQFVVGWLQNI